MTLSAPPCFPDIPANPPAHAPVDAPEVWRDFPPEALADLPQSQVLWSEVLPGGAHWSWRLTRGVALRFVALSGGANLSCLLYASHDRGERYNMPDSLKAQHTAHFTRGHVLMSDMGRAMASFTRDSIGWHDPFGLLLSEPALQAKYGQASYATHRNLMYRAGREGFLIELAKHGIPRRELGIPVNLFSEVRVDAEGRFEYRPRIHKPGAHVELRMDMHLLLALSSAPHPLDPSPTYAPADIGIVAWRCGPAGEDDYCRGFRPETARAHHNTDQLYS